MCIHSPSPACLRTLFTPSSPSLLGTGTMEGLANDVFVPHFCCCLYFGSYPGHHCTSSGWPSHTQARLARCRALWTSTLIQNLKLRFKFQTWFHKWFHNGSCRFLLLSQSSSHRKPSSTPRRTLALSLQTSAKRKFCKDCNSFLFSNPPSVCRWCDNSSQSSGRISFPESSWLLEI